MMDWTLVLVADMVAGLGARVKKWRRKEMVAVFWGELLGVLEGVCGNCVVCRGVGQMDIFATYLGVWGVCLLVCGGVWNRGLDVEWDEDWESDY